MQSCLFVNLAHANLALNFMTPPFLIRQVAWRLICNSIIRLDALSKSLPWGEALVVDALQTTTKLGH